MRNKKPKSIAIFLSLLMLTCFAIPMLSAQELTNVSVIAGTTVEESMTHEDIAPSSILGALIANVQLTYERFIDFAGIKVWRDMTTADETFELLIFPANTVVDFNNIVTGVSCALSENVTVNGVEGIWETFCITTLVAGADIQDLSLIDDEMVYDDLTTVVITGFDTNDAYFTVDGVNGTTNGIGTCIPSMNCPTVAELESVYSKIVDGDVLQFSTSVGRVVAVKFTDAPGIWNFLIDLNKDNVFNIADVTADGFSTNAIETQALSILPTDVYDLYAVVA